MSRSAFSSRWGLVLAALGMAVGTGNVWRFPRVMAQNGGGTFLVPWAIFLFTWSIPLLMAEFGIGRAARRGPVGAFTRVFGPSAAWRGGFVAFCTMAILFYYSVVTGWTLRYLALAVTGGLAAIEPGTAEAFFVDYTDSWWPALGHGVALGAAVLVVGRGVLRGIERASRVLVPGLFVVLVLSAWRGLTLEGAGDGVAFLTSIDWGRLTTDHEIWLEALSQSAWSTGAGWGLLVCYAIYADASMRAGRECVTTGIGNNLASLLAAAAILPAVFALAPRAGQDPAALVAEAGPASTGLTFVWIPVLFRDMPGGALLSVAFFLGLAFAALSSLIAMVELGVRTLVDLGCGRRRALGLVFVAGFVLGLPSAVDLAPGHDGLSVFGNQDWVWGVGLIVSGALLGVSVLSHGVGRFHREILVGPEGGSPGGLRGALVRLALGVLVPVQAAGLLAWWFWQAWTWTEGDDVGARFAQWLDPIALASVGTCLLQWGVVLAALLAANRWMARRASAPSVEDRVAG